MITIDHMYTIHHCCQKLRTNNLQIIMPLPENSSPDWMLLLTTHLHCHESEEPKGASNPELSHYSLATLLPLLSAPRNYSHNCPGEERKNQRRQKVPSSVQQTSSSLSCFGEAKPYSTGGSGPSRDLTHAAHSAWSLAKCFKAKPTALWELHCIRHSSMLFFVFRCWMA